MKKNVLFCLLVLTGFMAHAQAAAEKYALEKDYERIVGGDPAEGGDYPWMCSIILDIPIAGCGASLIRPQWVLTAGHCYLGDFITAEQILINSLTLDLDDLESYSELIDVEEFIVHEDYNPNSVEGPDIALIRLSEPSTIAPIELADISDAEYFEHGDPAQVLGWGLTEDGIDSDVLLHTNCRFFQSDSCEAMYDESPESFYDLNAGGNICAGYFEGESAAGAASGDSGAPLFFEDGDGNYKQVGVVSGGASLITTEEFPGVFTFVAEYIDWIENTIEEYEIAANIAKESREDLSVVYFADDRLEVQGLNSADNYQLSVHDLMGNVINSRELNQENTAELIVNDYSSGVYLIHIVNRSKGYLTVEKIVVQ